jgi:hypothetical protein
LALAGEAFISAQAPVSSVLSSQLAALQKHFPVLDERLGLHKIDRNFVLRPTCHADEISMIEVLPKHAFQDQRPEWKTPDSIPTLPLHLYRRVMQVIDKTKPLGRELRPLGKGIHFVVFGATSGFARYEHAVLSGRFVTMEPLLPASFRIEYLRPISGVVDRISPAWPEGYRVGIQDFEYWVPATESGKILVGAPASGVRMAGPSPLWGRDSWRSCRYERWAG